MARASAFKLLSTSAFLSVALTAPSAFAQSGGREAQIVVDAETNEVLFENNARESRRPASITKVMTLYLLFDALKQGSVSWNDRIVFSRNAAAQPPTKLFVGAGNSISVQTAIEALILRSANDVATAVAENLGGSEANFAQMMTSKARQLGMSSTTFRNASGLPDAAQRSTAEDLARLAIAIRRDFPDQYHWFATTQMSYNGQTITGHNHLMRRMQGMDGLKTGYTRASGFNLAATTERNGRRVVTVVLGGSNRFVRDDLVEALTESAYRDLGIGASQFASLPSAYQVNFVDTRDAADAAALIMDLPARTVTTGGSATMAMNRNGRRLSFERGAPTFQVADMTAPASRWPSRSAISSTSRDEGEDGGTDDGEESVAPRAAPTPVPVPFRVAVVAPTPSPLRQMASNTTPTTSPPLVVLPPVTAPQAAPQRAAVVVFPSTAPATSPTQLRGNAQSDTVNSSPPRVPAPNEANPTQMAQFNSVPSILPTKVSDPFEATAALQPDAVVPNAVATQMAQVAEQDAASLASQSTTQKTEELNGAVNLAENLTPAAETFASVPSENANTEAAPVQMAALNPDAVAAAQRRQEEANAREQARIAEAQAVETARRDAARSAVLAARELAQKEAAARRANERQLAETRAKAQQEKEARELALAERQAVRERATAAAAEERRQAEATRARTARGNAVVQVGAFKDRGDATAAIAQFSRFFPSFAQSEVTTVTRKDGIWYRARFAGLGALAAREACNLVTGRGGACAIVGD